jgi:hypothetical protein
MNKTIRFCVCCSALVDKEYDRFDQYNAFCNDCEFVASEDGADEVVRLAISNVLKAERAREKDRLVYHTELSNAKLWYDDFVK